MTKLNLLPRENICPDHLCELCFLLFNTRNEKRLGLWEIANRLHLSVEEIDCLETALGPINFKHLALLLDLYEIRLDFPRECFPGLPDKFYEKYFEVGKTGRSDSDLINEGSADKPDSGSSSE